MAVADDAADAEIWNPPPRLTKNLSGMGGAAGCTGTGREGAWPAMTDRGMVLKTSSIVMVTKAL